MSDVVQARCPHCKNILRIPANWVAQPMRCKFCQNIFQTKPMNPAAPTAQPVATPVRAAKPVAAPARPAAQPSRKVQPAAAPAAAISGSPFSFQHAVVPPQASSNRPRYRRGGNGGWWMGVLLGGGVLALAAIVVVVLGPQISELFNRTPTDTNQQTKAEDNKSGEKPANQNLPKVEDKKLEDKKLEDKKLEDKRLEDQKLEAKKLEEKKLEEKRLEEKKLEEKRLEEKKLKEKKKEPPVEIVKEVPPKKEPPKEKKLPPKNELFPRRALFVNVNDYLFANPLHAGVSQPPNPKDPFPGSNPKAIMYWKQRELKFPARQCAELSDHAREAHAPLKSVIEGTITEFLKTSREQDRLLLLFAGHAVEIEKEAYLVPLEGELSDAKTLIKLSWVYDQLKQCKARQKVLILDICRYNPSAGSLRPNSGELTEDFDAKLKQVPEGVEVLVSCDVKQQGLEFDNGSVFLQALAGAVRSIGQVPSGIQDAGSPIPMELLLTRINAGMDKHLAPYKLKQTARLFGKEKDGGMAPNPEEPMPEALTIAAPDGGPPANAALVQRLLDDINQIPPVRGAKAKEDALKVSSLPKFAANALEQYQADASSPELKKAILDAIAALNKSANLNFQETFAGANNAQVKNKIKDEQGKPGKAAFDLEEAMENLLEVSKDHLEKETSKRWKANYEYVLVRLKSRLVYLYEYNYLLAQIRTDSLPPLEAGFTGYRLGSKEKVTIPEGKVKDWVKDVRRSWDQIAKEYPDTPYAIMARRERMTVLGLEWRPTQR